MEICAILLTFEFLLEARIWHRAEGIGTQGPPVVKDDALQGAIAQHLLAYVQVSVSAGAASMLNSVVSFSITSLLSSPSSCAATVLA